MFHLVHSPGPQRETYGDQNDEEEADDDEEANNSTNCLMMQKGHGIYTRDIRATSVIRWYDLPLQLPSSVVYHVERTQKYSERAAYATYT